MQHRFKMAAHTAGHTQSPDIVIMLSTYNGEKYLCEQLDSLVGQRLAPGQDWVSLVRDDGSDDDTLGILDKYAKEYPGKFEIIRGSNIGWKRSFMTLLAEAYRRYGNAGFFAFCDQDDIWKPDKLLAAIRLMSDDISVPTLYCSNLSYFHNGQDMGLIKPYPYTPSYKNCLVRNYAAGCTTVMNNPLAALISASPPSIEVPHDQWCYCTAVLCGRVIIDKESHILYRQHSGNQIGASRGLLGKIKSKLVKTHSSSTPVPLSELASQLQDKHGVHMKGDAFEAVRKAAHYRVSPLSRLGLLLDNGYTRGNMASDLAMKYNILRGSL